MNKFKFKDDINLDDILKNFKRNEDSYDLDSPFDEFISINKQNRTITHYGYNGLITDWYRNGLLETVES